MDISKTIDPSNCTGRRDFLKSLLGLATAGQSIQTAEARVSSADFYWADLKTGQVGFPTGKNVSSGQPGSIMKLVAAAALSEENLLADNTHLECHGSIVLANQKYQCQHAHGRLTLPEALGQSCNVFFAQAANFLAPPIFMRWVRNFGLDRPIAGFAANHFPNRLLDHSQRYVLGLADDFQLQALQILHLAALIATRGNVMPLHSAEQPPNESAPCTLKLSARTWSVLQDGMRLACREGTAKQLDVQDKLQIAAKTGTTLHGTVFQSWITGYFPYNQPRYAFCVRAKSGTSQDQAVPLAHKFLFAIQWP